MQAQITHEPVPPPPPATVTVTMTYNEAQALAWLAGYSATASTAIHKHTRQHSITAMNDEQREAAQRAGSGLYHALRSAGVNVP